MCFIELYFILQVLKLQFVNVYIHWIMICDSLPTTNRQKVYNENVHNQLVIGGLKGHLMSLYEF